MEDTPKRPPGDPYICPVCKKPITKDTPCYQIRLGAFEDDGATFLPESDTGYYHEFCLVGFP